MEEFIKENGLSPEGDNIPDQLTNINQEGAAVGILVSTMEGTCMGITGQKDSIKPVINIPSSEQILFQD